MKSLQGLEALPGGLPFTLYLLSFCSVVVSDDCQPSTWEAAAKRAVPTPTVVLNATTRQKSASVAMIGAVQAGEINCRYWGSTYGDVNYYTCTQLAEKYDVGIELFFKLNPDLDPDCGNIQQNTDYCVEGFIEPVRATDGCCGPSNNNATCRGTKLQCCNAETWKCGNSAEDCAPGTCYEGACEGDSIYSTDGTCGHAHGNRLCVGKWGDCCNAAGACGTGADFCGAGVCQSGNCAWPSAPSSPLPWLSGNSTDGTCGGPEAYTCNVVFGDCCNRDGLCGSLPSDCGVGCQPEFGKCSPTTTSPVETNDAATCGCTHPAGPSSLAYSP